MWKVHDSEVPKSIWGLVQMCSDRTAFYLKFNAPAANATRIVRVNLNAKPRRSTNCHRNTLLGFLPAGSGEMYMEGRNAVLQKDLSRYGRTSSEAVPLQILLSHTPSSYSRKGESVC